MNRKLELLAPAGNEESFQAALDNGADAIYLGLECFNARGNIENFNRESLFRCTQKAHLFGKKVYLTINTLVKDEELDAVIDMIKFAVEIKIDAYIIQDIGLASLLQKCFPGIELHASTQMGVHNLEGVKFLKECGFKRVVLSRETPLREIKRISKNCDIDLEYFVQGALCVGSSGNCYLSSMLFNASGNRGKCKQLCRLKWNFNGKEGYLLSTKDFCMLPRLKELAEAGVCSFKIEGRARRASYVAASVAAYRKAIDSEFQYDDNEINNLKKVFNRGDFTEGYFSSGKIIYPQAQNHIGVKIGKVIAFKKGNRFNEVTIESTHDLKRGDTLKFFNREKEEGVVSPVDITRLSKEKYKFTTTATLAAGQEVRLIVDSQFEDSFKNNKPKIDVSGRFIAKANQKAELNLTAQNHTITVFSENIVEEAKNQPISKEDCLKAFSKCGEEFELKNLTCDIDNVFMAKSELNELRRKALEDLREKIIKANEIMDISFVFHPKTIKKSKNNDKTIAFFEEIEKLSGFDDYDYLVYSPAIYDKTKITEFADKFSQKNIFLELPVVAFGEDIEFLKEILAKNLNLGVYATNLYALTLASPEKTIIGSEMNVYNSQTLEFYSKLGYDKVVESIECETRLIGDCEIFKDNRAKKLIYFKHCPIKEHIGGDCGSCKFSEGLKYRLNEKTFALKRKKIKSCLFYLEEEI